MVLLPCGPAPDFPGAQAASAAAAARPPAIRKKTRRLMGLPTGKVDASPFPPGEPDAAGAASGGSGLGTGESLISASSRDLRSPAGKLTPGHFTVCPIDHTRHLCSLHPAEA